jgi:TRAP-type C4-dicarboxylate transport system permease small subunit
MGMLAAVYTYSQKMHVGVDIVTHALSAGLRRSIEFLIWSVCGAFSTIVLVFGGLRLMEITYTLGQRSSVLDAPMHLVYAIVPLCGALMTIYSIFFIGETLRGKSVEPDHTPVSGI